MSSDKTRPRVVDDSKEAALSPSEQALGYLLEVAGRCQQRGGYNLEEAVALHSAQKYFATPDRDPTDDEREGSQHLRRVVQLLEKSQSLGKLTLEEAWTIVNAIRLFSGGGAGNKGAAEPARAAGTFAPDSTVARAASAAVKHVENNETAENAV